MKIVTRVLAKVGRCIRSGLSAGAAVLGVGLASSTASAQTAAESTAATMTGTFERMNFDPVQLANDFVAQLGPIYVMLLIFGFAISTGWIVFKHYRRAASKG